MQSESQGEEKSSIVGKEEKLSDPDDGTNKLKNSSEFKTTFGSQSSSDTFRNSFTLFGRKIDPAEINNVFPIIFGHHAICVACAIMYSPYIYQVGASLIYCLLLIPLFFAFTSASFKIVTFIWTCNSSIKPSDDAVECGANDVWSDWSWNCQLGHCQQSMLRPTYQLIPSSKIPYIIKDAATT